MISVENFYYVLYANLLRPVGLDCWYYYPFGTTDNFSANGEFHPWHPKHENHVLFHFDQEPILTHSLGQHYDDFGPAYSAKICKLLANSERSDIKQQICRDRSMLDWYFFYHGFAAQDWFRDARYLQFLHEPTRVFASYNHLVSHKRSYRMALTARLMREGVVDRGDISFHGTQQDCETEIDSIHSQLSAKDKSLIETTLCADVNVLPMWLDHASIDASYSARFGHQEYQLWQNSLWHLVNETVFYDAKLHLTEKIFKPIVALRPFVLVAAPGNLAYLKSYGFRTFDTWIDEGYDDIRDNDSRLDHITREVTRLCSLSTVELRDMFRDMQDTLIFNKHHFFTRFRDTVVDELVDNFDACIRIWNSGRVDVNRIMPRDYDVDVVKHVLKS